jgi:hypothetical protein
MPLCHYSLDRLAYALQAHYSSLPRVLPISPRLRRTLAVGIHHLVERAGMLMTLTLTSNTESATISINAMGLEHKHIGKA